MKLDVLSALNRERRARCAALVVTDLDGGAQRLVTGDQIAADPLAAALQARLRAGKSGVIEHQGRSWFVTVHAPVARIVITGAVHISQALAPMARMLDFEVTIVDPRRAFASPERFPDINVIAEWPDSALPRVGLDAYTAFIALTHDPKIDDPALAQALGAECFYVGALGSRKTHAQRVARLTTRGFSAKQIARIHAPVGLAIGAVSPAEIAVSIMAEITAALRLGRAAAPVPPTR